MRPHAWNTAKQSRTGVLSMELVLVLPLLAVALFAVVELALLFNARQSLLTASRAGARTASLAGATLEGVERSVREQLDLAVGEQLAIDVELGERCGDPVGVALRVPMGVVSPDLLAFIGLSLGDRELVAETVMCKE